MKKLITILLIFIAIYCNAQIELSESYAPRKDKLLHAGVGVAEGAVVYSLVYSKTNDARGAFRVSLIGINFLALGKEVIDMSMGKPMSLADILYANIGCLIGSGITYLTIKGIEKRKQKKLNKLLDIEDEIWSLDNEFINNNSN